MATIANHPDDMSITELRQDVARLEREISDAHRYSNCLKDDVRHLKSRLEDLEDAESRLKAIRDQLDTLSVDPPTATPEQLTRLLNGILRGEDWRNGTWR